MISSNILIERIFIDILLISAIVLPFQRMVMTFRVSELQMLLGYAGKNKTGRKNELQSRAIEIVRLRNPAIQAKIKELYKSIQ